MNIAALTKKNTKFVNSLMEICNKTIPKTKIIQTRKKVVPWWNNEGAEVVKAKNKAYTKYKRYHTMHHLLDYREKRKFKKNPTILRVKKKIGKHFAQN